MATQRERTLAKMRKQLAGGRKPSRNNPVVTGSLAGTLTRNVTILDINEGAWSLIDQPPATTGYDFL